jgi:hypothetical protein
LIRAHDQKRKPEPSAALLPTSEDGLRGMRFIAATIESSTRDSAWVPIG